MILTPYTNGSVTAAPSLAQLSIDLRRSNKPSGLFIIDLKSLFETFKKNQTLALVSRYCAPHDVLKAVIEEPPGPSEYPICMDYILDQINGKIDPMAMEFSDTLLDIEIEIEKLQIYADVFFFTYLPESFKEHELQYQILKWLGGTCCIMSVQVR